MQDRPDYNPDPLTLDPDDPRVAAQVWIHDQLDRVERRNDHIRDYEAREDVRDERAQAYLDRKEFSDRFYDAAQCDPFMVTLAVCALIGAGLWALMLSVIF